jgi:RHS repeat-associated protein
VYNGDGARVAGIVDGLRTDYVQDVGLPLPQVLTARQGGTTSRYLRGLGLLAEQQGSGPAAWSYYLPDALGSVRQVADPTGQVTLTRRYDPFGNLVYQSTNLPISPRYGFAGEEQDPLTGQVFLRARGYAPSTGRFLQTDPLPGIPGQPNTLHRYAYAFDNPVNYVDPAGTLPLFNDVQRPLSYRQDLSRLRGWAGQPLAPGGFASRSVNAMAQGLSNWVSRSDPVARTLSQGHRAIGCGVAGLVNAAQNFRDYFQYFVQTPGQALSQIYQGARGWLSGQIDFGLQFVRNADARMLAIMTFNVATGLMTAGLIAALGPAGLLAIPAMAVINTAFGNRVYGQPFYGFANLLPNTTAEMLELAGGAVGGAFGPWGALLGTAIGAGVGQTVSNALTGRPLDEGLLFSMAFATLTEGVGIAGGHIVGSRLRNWMEADLSPSRRQFSNPEMAEAWARTGANLDDPYVRRMIERGYPPVMGGGLDVAGSRRIFSPEMEAGLEILETYKPEYAELIRRGIIPLEEGPRVGKSGGISLPDRIVVSTDPRYSLSTAAALYEEIYHAFQGPGLEQIVELEAKTAMAEWVLEVKGKTGLEYNPLYVASGDIVEFETGGIAGLERWVSESISNRPLEAGMLYGRENILPLLRNLAESRFARKTSGFRQWMAEVERPVLEQLPDEFWGLGALPPETARTIQRLVDEVGYPLAIVGGYARVKYATFKDIDYAAVRGNPLEAYHQALTEGRLPGAKHIFPLSSLRKLGWDLGVILFQPNEAPIYHPPDDYTLRWFRRLPH